MKLNVAAVQLSSGSDIARNVDAAIGLVHEAADRGAEYVQVPEYFNFLGPFSGFADAAETVPGDTTRRMAEVAVDRHVTLHLGSLIEQSPIEGKFFNTSVVIGPSGSIVATYRKVHLFDVDVPGASLRFLEFALDGLRPGHRSPARRSHGHRRGAGRHRPRSAAAAHGRGRCRRPGCAPR